MKSFRSTLIFALVVAALVGYAVFEMKRGEEKEATEAKQDLLFKIDEKDVQELQIFRPDGSLQLVREKDALRIKSPVDDKTDDFGATSFLNSILNQKAKPVEGEKTDWKDYGLEEPRLRVEVSSTKGEKQSYSFGLETAYDGSYFIRDGDKLLIGESDWGRLLHKEANELRDKKLFHFGDRVVGIHLQSPLEKVDLKLVSRDDKWVYERDESIVLSKEEVERYLTDVTNYRATDFVAEETSSQTLKKYGLDKPQLIIGLWMEHEKSEGPQWVLKVAKEKSGKDAYGYYSGQSTIYKLASDAPQSLLRGLDSFRDKKAPFEFKADKVKELSLRTALTDIRLVKKEDKWEAAEPVPGKEVDQTVVQGLLSKLGEMETRYYLEKKPKNHGLGKNANSLKLVDAEGKPVFELDWGSTFKAKQEIKSAGDEELYYAKTNLVPETLGVAMNKIDELPRQTLLKDIKKEEVKGDKSDQVEPMKSEATESKK